MIIFDKLFKSNILKKVENKNKIFRIIIYILCCFFIAITYNVFFVPNDLVTGGMSGLAIVFKQAFGINTSTFLLISTIILLILNWIFLGKEKAKKNIACAIAFPILVKLTEPLSANIDIEFKSYILTILIGSITHSIPLGIVYKIGYSTGGTDLIMQIICKYAKTSIGQAGNYINILIIFTSIFVFGVSNVIYGIFSLLIMNKIIDFIILGNSDSKLCIIKTKNVNYIEEFLSKDFNIGYSILNSKGGIDKKKRKTIMCIVSSREYYRFKNLIMDIDSNAFFVTHDCYEVLGGNSKRLIKFN
ncbi:MAG: YitT family protein [Bacilli bacterium]|nr:YitT family protein [Bacilli bacterium]